MCAEQRRLEFLYQGSLLSRLDKFILEQLTAVPDLKGLSRSQIKLWIERGAVSVDGVVVLKAGAPLRPGACVLLLPPEPEPTTLVPYAFDLKILYEDESILVIDKPAGLSMHPGAGNRTRTLVNAVVGRLSDQLPGQAVLRPGVVHRLDKDTTGVVVLAKTVEAHVRLVEQFAARTVERAYYAVVLSAPRAKHAVARTESGTISAALGRHPTRRKEFSVVTEGGKHAVTHWRVVERLPYAALLEVRLETGRTHQIRVHMTSIGAPLLGDETYTAPGGLPREIAQVAADMGRQALHAFLLGFRHPISGEMLRFTSELPADFELLLSRLRGT